MIQSALFRLTACRVAAGLCVALSGMATWGHAGNWPQLRGPNFDGSNDETGLPASFSKTENVKWVAELAGSAAATPVIWGDHVFLSGIDSERKIRLAIALDRKTGDVLWTKEVGVQISRDNRSNFASPTPATDGERVYFFYGTGDLMAFDFAGNEVWSRNLEKDYGAFAFLWTFSSSPALIDGRLILQVLQRDKPVQGRGRSDGPIESYLLALDPKTGKNLWKTARPSEAREESLEAFSSPVGVAFEGRTQILVAGGDCLSGTDLATGEELWRWGTWNPDRIGHWRLVPSPVCGAGMVLACGPKGEPVYGVKLGARGALPHDGFAWKSEEPDVSADVTTPLFYRGKFYVLNGMKGVLSRVDPATGKADWSGELGAGGSRRVKIESSPTAGDGKIYFMNFKGTVFVAEAGDAFKILHTAEMGEPGDNELRATISISQGNLYIRNGSKLYCIGK